MNLNQVEVLLAEIERARGIDEFVVIGSVSVLGILGEHDIPPGMLLSNDLDAYPRHDPAGAGDLVRDWGQGSAFDRKNGYYFDPVSPHLASLPSGWEQRLIVRPLPSGGRVAFLEPHDAAISKYARGEERDRRWIREGLAASILSLASLDYRCRETDFLDDAERAKVKAALAEDRAWFKAGRQPD